MLTPYLPPIAPFLGGPGVYPRTILFSYQEGEQLLEFVERIRQYLVDTLAPALDADRDAIIAAFDTEVAKMILAVDTALETQSNAVAAELSAQTTSVNSALAAQLASVVTQLANQLALVTQSLAENVVSTDTAVTEMTAYVNSAVASIINSTIAVTDPVVIALLNNSTSNTYKRLYNDFSKVVTVQGFGGIGDGVNDDTAAFQAAVDSSWSTGKPVEIRGRIRTTAPIVLKTGRFISIRGMAHDANAFDSLTVGVSTVESESITATFTSADAGQVKLELENVNFRNRGGLTTGANAALFSGVKFADSVFQDVQATSYGYIFKTSPVGTSRINGCKFVSMRVKLSDSDIVDSYVTENYFNGEPSQNATCFYGLLSTTIFANNYIDFFKRVFDLRPGCADIRVIGNIFDYCWNVFGSSTPTFMTSLTVIGNTAFHNTKTDALPYFTSADADMTGTPWIFMNAAEGINKSTFSSNQIYGSEVGFRFRAGTLTAFRSIGNVYNNAATTRIDFAPSGDGTNALKDVYIEELEGRRLTTPLPNPSLLIAPANSYDRNTAYLSGKMIYNDNGVWKDAMGTTVT